MAASRTKRPAAKPVTSRSKPKIRPVTARQLLRGIAQLQEERGLDETLLIGALCELIAANQPTARQALRRIEAMLDAEGIR